MTVQLGLTFEVIDSMGVLIQPQHNSVSRGLSVPIGEMRCSTLIALLPKLKEKSERDHVICCLIAQSLVLCARRLWRKGQKAEALEKFDQARELSPTWADAAYRSFGVSLIAKIFGFQTLSRSTVSLVEFLKSSSNFI